MFRELKFRGIVTFSEKANQWIFFLQKLPLLGKHISDSWYTKTALKTAFGILGMIGNLLWAFCCKVLYGLVFFLLPMLGTCFLWYPEEMQVPDGVSGALVFYYFLILNVCYGSLGNARLFSATEEDFVMLSHFHVPARGYLLSSLLWRAVLEASLFLPVLWLPFGLPAALCLTAVRFGFRLFGEAAGLALYRWKQPDMTKLTKTMTVLIVMALALGYGMPFLLKAEGVLAIRAFFSLPVLFAFALLSGGLGLLSWRYLKGYQGYSYLVKRFYNFERIQEMDVDEGAMLKAEINIEDKDAVLTEREQKKLSALSGYEYLNALFFFRHKKLLMRSARRKQLVLAALGGALLVGAYFLPGDIRENVWELLTTWVSGILVFVMYLLASGQRTCKAFFFHCDESLLKYGYYRQPGVLLKNFRIRLRYIMKQEWMVASVISLFFLLLPFVLGKEKVWYLMLPVAAEALLLAAFFAMFHLFCYYVFQPYTAEATMKNPIFTVLNTGIYIVSYVCMQLREISLWFAVGVLVVILIFLPLAFWAIYRFAPRTFRVRG